MSSIKDSVHAQFSKTAFNYSVSSVHANGQDLKKMVETAKLTGGELVLDAGCGAGHTALAFAPHVAKVVAFDLSAQMLAQVTRLAAERNLANIETRVGDVEALPFEDASFDLVISRLSAHHWPNPVVALSEIRRVLKPGGMFILSDVVASEEPALDTLLQTIELLRDPSHVRDHAISGWVRMFQEVGAAAEVVSTWPIALNFVDWIARMETPQDRTEVIRWLFRNAPAEAQHYFDVQDNDDFSLTGALLTARF
jgi:ubiquinone/menaquinone biosynthesis C-methylase UbiE